MKALLLAAGLGTRLRPLTLTTPKCLVPIAGKPLLEYWLEKLESENIDTLINTHYMSELVIEYLKGHPHRNRIETVSETILLGTGGTLLKNRKFFANDSILLVHADNLSRFSLPAFQKAHAERPSGCVMTMMTFESPAPETCGILELDSRGVVTRMHEKVKNPPGNLANAAVYILEPSIMAHLESLGRDVIDFSTEVIPHFLGKIATFANTDYHRDIGSIESYEKANLDFKT